MGLDRQIGMTFGEEQGLSRGPLQRFERDQLSDGVVTYRERAIRSSKARCNRGGLMNAKELNVARPRGEPPGQMAQWVDSYLR